MYNLYINKYKNIKYFLKIFINSINIQFHYKSIFFMLSKLTQLDIHTTHAHTLTLTEYFVNKSTIKYSSPSRAP